ncbi:MAG TPA: cytochrome C oxidase subunit IV family protein [Phycisphaerales bacterium]|nr:cytochrome C oxidase subunit IV family protein [Phycisphaerales bacterium]HMP36025.1 cytochrome C oxidase subunit IV family protein [Phycisphaerales bacterium]
MASPAHSHSHGDDRHHAPAGGHGHGDDHPLVGHLVPMSTLIGTAVVLLALTFFTVAARWLDVGEFNIVIALAIATVKATLVGLYFMHLRWDRPFNVLTFVGSVAFVGLFMGFALIDVHAYELERDTGNPIGVVTVLEQTAPAAPIATR